MRRLTLLALAALLLGGMTLVVAGCGKKATTATPADTSTTTTVSADGIDTTTTDTTSTDATTTDATTTTESETTTTTVASDSTTTTDSGTTTTTENSGPDLSVLTSAKCRELLGISQAFAMALTGADQDLDRNADQMREFADQAPEEIRADFQTLADAYVKAAKVLKGVDLAGNGPPSAEAIAKLTELSREIDTTKVTAASTNIANWATKNCAGTR